MHFGLLSSFAIPEKILVHDCVFGMQLSRDQDLDLQRTYPEAIRADPEKLTFEELERAVRKVLAPDPEMERLKRPGRASEPQSSGLYGDNDRYGTDYADDEEAHGDGGDGYTAHDYEGDGAEWPDDSYYGKGRWPR